jgi:transposase
MSRYDLTDFEWRVIEPLLAAEMMRTSEPPH